MRAEFARRFGRLHPAEYLADGALLALFLVSACVYGVLLFEDGARASALVSDPSARRLVMGAAMGLTAIALIHSPLGQRSGAHMNPAITLAFLRLGRIRALDAAGYVSAQIVGALAGMVAAWALLGSRLADAGVNFVATTPASPSSKAALTAWIAEFVMAFTLLSIVLALAARRASARFAGVASGVLVALFIFIGAPLSGMSLNPARSLGSALFAMRLDSIWIYATAPVLAMLLAAEIHRRGGAVARCAKLVHTPRVRCIHCGAGAGSSNHGH